MTQTTPVQDTYTRFSCPHPQCRQFNRPGEGNIAHRSWTGKHQHIERLRCTACGREFSERAGTLTLQRHL
jgi:transposase-like protein